MRNLLTRALAAVALTFVFGATAPADTDPTVHQIYEAAASGHLDQAQQMMDQVLKDHPNSARAHYVQSELYAREGRLDLARTELERAEQLEPGLPKEKPRSVAELKSQLGLIRRPDRPMSNRESAPHFPWSSALVFVLVAGAIWLLFRRRTSSAQYPPGSAPMPGAYGPGGYGPGGPAGPGGAVSGGIGSSVAGGLAGGLAAGAGIVAGEALAHRFIDGEHSSEPLRPGADESESSAANSDMGGADFGVNDPDSWDDGSGSGGGGGGDDWT
jgi:hypothetical protein